MVCLGLAAGVSCFIVFSGICSSWRYELFSGDVSVLFSDTRKTGALRLGPKEITIVGILEDRGKGLEEEYFHRKNAEAIEKLRQKMAIAEQAKAAGTSSMQCPRCDCVLKESIFEKVQIDTCAKCGGIWFDARELEQVIKSEDSGWLGKLWSSWHQQ
jgi:hypothetical protein